MPSGLLVFPPGWSLDVAGPHLALPMLRGFCASRGIELTTLDLNIETAARFGAVMEEGDAVHAGLDRSFTALNAPYQQAQASLERVARRVGGRWTIREGYCPPGFQAASSSSVREFSRLEMPYSALVRDRLEVEAINADIVGISVAVPQQLLGAFHVAALLRELGYAGRILLGGNTPTRLSEQLAHRWVFDLVDGVVLYGGELGLAACLSKDRSWPDEIPNLMWWSGEGLVKNRTEHLSPSEFKQPIYDQISSGYWGINHLPIVGFRGCYFGRCDFCAIPFAWGPKGRLGMDSPEAVFKTVVKASALTGISKFKFVDEAIHPGFLRSFAGLVCDNNLPIEFEAYARLDPFLLDTELMELAAAAGLRKLYIGLELEGQEGRDLLGKEDTANPSEALRVLNALGIKVHLFCMFGYPGTTAKDALRTVEFLLQHREQIDTVDIARFRLEKHTTVPGVERVVDLDRDWSLWDAFVPTIDSAMNESDAIALCSDIEDLIWNEEPSWLHPTYRLASPWLQSFEKLASPARSPSQHSVCAQ